MFYISSKKDGMFGVTDSSDNVEEFYKPSDIKKFINSGVTIKGAEMISKGFVIKKLDVKTKPDVQSKLESMLLEKLSVGLPVRVKMSSRLDFKQCIYVGKKRDRTFFFYDGSGVNGKFGISSDFLKEHEDDIEFDFNNNDPVEVTRLLKKLESNKSSK